MVYSKTYTKIHQFLISSITVVDHTNIRTLTESTCRLLSSTPTIANVSYNSARKLRHILASHSF